MCESPCVKFFLTDSPEPWTSQGATKRQKGGVMCVCDHCVITGQQIQSTDAYVLQVMYFGNATGLSQEGK